MTAPTPTPLELAGIAIDRVSFLERRYDEVSRELEGATKLVAVLIRQAGGRVEVDPVELIDDVVVRRVDDPATGRLILEVWPA